MAVQASKLISLTNLTTGGTMKLSANKIVKFTADGSDTLLTYVSQSGKVVTQLMDETVSTINTAADRTQAVTLNSDGSTVYIHSDKIIYLDSVTAGTNITYYNEGKNEPEIIVVTEVPSDINTAAGNTFAITSQPTLRSPSATRYINNLFIDMVTVEDAGTLPSISFTTKAKIGTGVVVDDGTSGITAATVTFSGGGATVQATGTLTVAAGVITAFTIDTAGSGYTSYPTITVNVTSGTAGSTPSVTCSFAVESPMTIVDAGANLNTAPTLTFSATTGTLATATTTLDADTQTISDTTLTNAGSYKSGTDTYPTLTVSGGTGANILYDEKKVSYKLIGVEETAAQIQTAVNAL